ncbi:hypothetical protein RJ641_001860 [Dillenia turbinata]|uniref:Uncharacterized protein n=1 Tax=Dillenia turbinata TaxID=194707 RepID=A0AAN8ZBN6_9MAGN
MNLPFSFIVVKHASSWVMNSLGFPGFSPSSPLIRQRHSRDLFSSTSLVKSNRIVCRGKCSKPSRVYIGIYKYSYRQKMTHHLLKELGFTFRDTSGQGCDRLGREVHPNCHQEAPAQRSPHEPDDRVVAIWPLHLKSRLSSSHPESRLSSTPRR